MKPFVAAQAAFIAIVCIAVFIFVRAARNDHQRATCSALCAFKPNYAARNRTVPDFELKDYFGRSVRLSSLRDGKPMVLNFWTKNCKPCLEEMPSLGALANILADRGASLVTVCTDDGPAAVREHLRKIFGSSAPPFPILFDPDSEIVGDKFGTTLFPETWLIDGDGVIRARVDGKRDWTKPLALEVVEMLGRPGGCAVEFARGRPLGPLSGLCDPS